MRSRIYTAAALGWLVLQLGPLARAQQSISASNTSRYVGGGRWDWTVFIQASPAILSQIKCVEYTLDPTFPNPVRRVCDRGRDSQAFSLSNNGWGVFTIPVRVFFRDGKTQRLEYRLTLAAPSVADYPPEGVGPRTSCKTQISLSILEGAVRRLKGGWPYISIYAEEVHEDKPSHFYIVNTEKYVAQDSERLSEKDFGQRLRNSEIRPAIGADLAPDTYRKISLGPDKSETLGFPSGKLSISISNPQSHKYVDINVCIPSTSKL